jgi:hypothetical protein
MQSCCSPPARIAPMPFILPDPAYDVAQICLNGHVINDCARWSPELNQDHCEKCGEPTTTECQSCGSEIRGRLLGPGIIHVQFFVPSYCWKCGKPYPWTERRLRAAKQLADELEELEPADRDELKASIDDLAKDSPAAELAGKRFKMILGKLGKGSAAMVKSVVTDLLSETLKKTLFP